jgi:hypothetical protein
VKEQHVQFYELPRKKLKSIRIKNKNDMAYRKVMGEYNEIKTLIKERLGR